MKDIGLDFGLLIAYFVPGVVGLAALRPLLGDLVPPPADTTGLGSSVVSAALALIVGMLISLVRGSTLDHSFALNLHKLGVLRSRPHYGACRRQEVDYRVLSAEGPLNAFREAVLQDKRPYQFYGNTFVATMIWALTRPKLPVSLWALLVLSWLLLYIGSRRSHFVFMQTVATLNELSTSSAAERA